MKKTFYAWKDAPFTDRLSVYDNYVYLTNKAGHYSAMDFEEFNETYRHDGFYSVANKYGVYDE